MTNLLAQAPRYAASVRRAPDAPTRTSRALTRTGRALTLSRRALAPARRALTLVELLVVIAVLVTLVVGVIPILSPNNDQRKIREAARELHTLVMQAQAQAARTGRPSGIAFVETDPGSGMATEAFFVAQPPPYAGFGQDATINVAVDGDTLPAFLNNGPTYDVPVLISFGRGLGESFMAAESNYEAFPPKLLRLGDVIRANGNLFRIARGSMTRTYDASGANDNFSLAAFVEPMTGPVINAVWINNKTLVTAGDQRLLLPAGGTRYVVERQPSPSSGAPLQFPSGVGVDLDGSGFEVVVPVPADPVNNPPRFGFRSLISRLYTLMGGGTQPLPFSAGADEQFAQQNLNGARQGVQVSVMFAPQGHLTDVYVNNELQNTGESRVYFLVGRLENALPNVGVDYNDTDVSDFSGLTDNEVETERVKVNWLDLDSRWVTVSRQAGRVVVSENAFVDPRPAFDGNDPRATRAVRIDQARRFAREMRRVGN